MLKQHNNNTLGLYLIYGKMFNYAFTQHELEKEGRTDRTLEEWLKDNGISSSKGRKIRSIVSPPVHYPGFMRLGFTRMVLPLWCQLTQVVVEKRPLNECSVVVVVVFHFLKCIAAKSKAAVMLAARSQQ